MGRIAKLLSFVRVVRNNAKVSDVKVDPGGGANITAEHFASPGDDSSPLPGDYVALITASGSGRESAVGYVDAKSDQKSLSGDKRIYARDGNGLSIGEVWLKNTGEISISNDNGSFTLRPDGSIKGVNGSGSFELAVSGDFLINGVTIDTTGNITTTGVITGATVAATTNLTVDSKEMGLHTHDQGDDSDGDTQVDTGAPV